MIKEGKDQIAYGDRSRHVNSVRIAHGGRPSPDNWGLTFHVAAPLQDSVGVITPSSLHYMGTTRGSFLPGPRSPGAPYHDSRHGGPSADLHHGGLEAPPLRHPHSFHRVRGESIVAESHDRSGNARHDELRRMDRHTPFDAAQGVRPEKRGILVRRGRGGGSEGSLEHADCQGDGRLHPGLRHEWRGRATAARVSAAADDSRLRRHFSHQVAAANQGGRPLLHELQRLRAS